MVCLSHRRIVVILSSCLWALCRRCCYCCLSAPREARASQNDLLETTPSGDHCGGGVAERRCGGGVSVGVFVFWHYDFLPKSGIDQHPFRYQHVESDNCYGDVSVPLGCDCVCICVLMGGVLWGRDLNNNAITTITSGVFDGLSSLMDL